MEVVAKFIPRSPENRAGNDESKKTCFHSGSGGFVNSNQGDEAGESAVVSLFVCGALLASASPGFTGIAQIIYPGANITPYA